MCYAIINATFAAGEEPQILKLETKEDFDAKVQSLKDNDHDHCTGITVYKREVKHVKQPVWVIQE